MHATTVLCLQQDNICQSNVSALGEHKANFPILNYFLFQNIIIFRKKNSFTFLKLINFTKK